MGIVAILNGYKKVSRASEMSLFHYDYTIGILKGIVACGSLELWV
jgi:hypothetical protein